MHARGAWVEQVGGDARGERKVGPRHAQPLKQEAALLFLRAGAGDLERGVLNLAGGRR